MTAAERLIEMWAKVPTMSDCPCEKCSAVKLAKIAKAALACLSLAATSYDAANAINARHTLAEIERIAEEPKP